MELGQRDENGGVWEELTSEGLRGERRN